MILRLFSKIRRYGWVLRYFPSNVYFNFHYLPFHQARKLPILLYKPCLYKMDGKVILNLVGGVKFGMIQIGVNTVSLYENHGIRYENHGGTIVFRGKCKIGNNSAISIGSSGYIEFGQDFRATTSFRITSYKSIIFGRSVLLGWDVIVSDSDFHSLSSQGGTTSEPEKEIAIGDYSWIAMKCLILKGTNLPRNTTVAANSQTNKVYDIPPCSLLAGIPARFIKTGCYLDRNND